MIAEDAIHALDAIGGRVVLEREPSYPGRPFSHDWRCVLEAEPWAEGTGTTLVEAIEDALDDLPEAYS